MNAWASAIMLEGAVDIFGVVEVGLSFGRDKVVASVMILKKEVIVSGPATIE